MAENTRKPMSRGEAVFLIILAIIVAALLINRQIAKNNPSDPWAECVNLFGHHDSACKAEVSGRRLDAMH